MVKRSPILGYNHNVRYRGLVFHVQTEDSGVLSPHLFTHLFHTGVIVSTRKLVYDAGSAEDAIKSLMQAQHKAVLKDLKRGVFDDKIDKYLGGTPGLLPRSSEQSLRDSEPVLAVPEADQTLQTPRGELPEAMLEDDGKTRRDVRDPTLRDVRANPAVGRAPTAERGSAPSAVRVAVPVDPPPPAPSDDIDAPTDLDGVIASAVPPGPTVRTPVEDADERDSGSQPEIEIQLELDEPDEAPPPQQRARIPRDTDVAVPRGAQLDEHTRPTIDVSALSDGIPGILARPATAPVPPQPTPAPGTLPNARPPSAVGAATLPPARPITRPPNRPAITPPQVLSRPIENARGKHDSDAVEVYAPPPPSADPPPGERERPGAYAQHRRSAKLPPLANEPPPVPPSRPGTGSTPQPRADTAVPRAPRPGSQQVATQPIASGPRPPVRDAPPPPVPAPPVPAARPTPDPTLPIRGRTTTPTRTSGSQPTQARTGSPSSGVVMTRPAVIVGAPAKPTQPRVRKAREDEGRGFGQGLISEKSLDEVILAYLSEDAEENK